MSTPAHRGARRSGHRPYELSWSLLVSAVGFRLNVGFIPKKCKVYLTFRAGERRHDCRAVSNGGGDAGSRKTCASLHGHKKRPSTRRRSRPSGRATVGILPTGGGGSASGVQVFAALRRGVVRH